MNVPTATELVDELTGLSIRPALRRAIADSLGRLDVDRAPAGVGYFTMPSVACHGIGGRVASWASVSDRRVVAA